MAITLASQAFGVGGSGAATIASSAQAHSAGRVLVVTVKCLAGAITIDSLADLAGNTYVALPQLNAGARMRQFYCLSSLAHAANVVTATFSGSTANRWIHVAEYTTSLPLHFVQSLEQSTTGGAPTSQAFNTQDNVVESLVLVGYAEPGPATVTAGSGYTLLNGNLNSEGGVMYRVVSTPISLGTAAFASTNTGPGVMCVLVLAPYPGTEALIRSTVNGGGQLVSSVTSSAFPVNPEDDEDILVFVSRSGGGGAATAPTDSEGNTYTLVAETPIASWAGTNAKLTIWRATGINGGSGFTVTANFSSAPFACGFVAHCVRYLGAYNADLVQADELAASSPSSGATVVTPPAGSLAFALSMTNAGGNNLFPSAGWISGSVDRQNVNAGLQDLYTAHRGVTAVFTGTFLATAAPARSYTAALSFAGSGPEGEEEVIGDEAEFVDGTVSEPLTWLEHTDRSDQLKPFAEVDLNDPDWYYGGYKAPKVVRFLPITRGLSDRTGQIEHLAFGATMSDTDRYWRGLLASPTTKYLTNTPILERMIDDEERRVQGLPRLCAVGYVNDYSPRPDLQFELQGSDWLKKKYSRKRRAQQNWQPLITVEDFPNAPTEIVGTAVPIIYGELSDKSETTETVPADPGTPTTHGLRKPTNLQATVVGAAGSNTYTYGVTARDEQATGWSDHRGETDAAYVTVINAPSLDQMSASRYVELTWDAVPGAFRYRIYGRKSGGTVDLNALDSSASPEYHDGELHGRREVDVEKAHSHPPAQNNTVITGDPGTPETSITTDTGSGVVPVTYTGLREVDGEDLHEFLVCGHAIKPIDGVYQNGVRIADDVLADAFLIPGTAEWTAAVGANDYRDFNGRRYTVLYARQGGRGTSASEGEEPLTLNVQGIEDAGDGSGDLIRSPVLQRLHFMNNWIAPDTPYQSGAYLDAADTLFPHPELGTLPIVDEDSHEAVEAEMQARLDGGYETAGVIGAKGEFISANDALARFHVSGDFDQVFNRKGQDSVSIEPNAAPSGTRITDVLSVLDGSFEVSDEAQQLFFNLMPFVDTPNYTDRQLDSPTTRPGWFRLNEVRSQISIDLYDQERESPAWELHFGWSFTAHGLATINDVMGRKLARYRDPQRKVSMTGPFSFLNHEPGDVVRVTHFEGIGAEGWADRRIRITRHEVEPTEGRVRLEGYDLDLILAAGFILGGDDIADSWDDADSDDRQYGYLAGDDDQFSDGEPAKVLQ